MKWIVGLDLRPTSRGAVKFAAWLAQHTKEPARERMVAVHVLEEEHLRVVLRYHHLDEVIEAARFAASRTIETSGAQSVIATTEILQGLTAEKSLEAARIYHHADGIIVGRQAEREGSHLVRLGKVARRLLRQLSAPTVVVPPDLDPETIGKGPVLALSKLSEDSEAACRFAGAYASRLGRELVIAHVVPMPEDYGVQYLPANSLEKLRAEHETTGKAALQDWLTAQGLAGQRSYVVQGQLVPQAMQLARQLDAAAIVCGSRRLNTFERVLLTSSGSELAAHADRPVIVVPPTG